jgi:HK97 family phage portal protein
VGLLSRALFRADTGIDRSPWSDYWYGPIGGQTLSGIKVGVEAALSASPVWAAVRLLADSVAALPLVIFKRRADGGKDRDPNHPIYDLLHESPNPLMTAYNFKRVMMVWCLLWGNAYAEIRPGRRGTVDTLWPLHPDGVRIEEIPGGKIRYQVRQRDGTEKAYDDEQIFHIPGLSLNGISGMSVMQIARESIGLSIAAKNFSSGFFSRGGRPSGILTHPGKLTKDGRTNMREEWEAVHATPHRVAILQEGVTWHATGLSSEDAQLLGLLEWSAADIARYFNVPLHLLQETAKVTSWGSGIEELNSAFVTYSLLPWLVNWQQTITKDLIVFNQFFFAEFIVDALLRGKTLERYQAYQIASGSAPWLAPNEIRAAENRNPLPGGDELQKPPTSPAPRPPAAPPSNQPKQPDALAEMLARDTAARIVRRETAALGRVAQRGPLSPEAWAEAVGDFYAEHAPFVAEALHIDAAAVGGYIRKQIDTLIAAGPGAAMDWEAERVEYLTTLALEAQE